MILAVLPWGLFLMKHINHFFYLHKHFQSPLLNIRNMFNFTNAYICKYKTSKQSKSRRNNSMRNITFKANL